MTVADIFFQRKNGMHGDGQITGLKDALRQSPDNVPLRLLLADTLRQANRHPEALVEYQEVLRRQPASEPGQFGMASSQFAAGHFVEAATLLERLVASNSRHADAHLLLSRALAESGQPEKARQHYESAIGINPGLSDKDLAGELFQGGERPRQRLRVVKGDGGGGEGIAGAEEKPSITFADVGGMDSVKESIRMSVIYPLQKPELFAAYGKKAGGGLLLFGPPGCGKTHIGRATAGEVGFTFIHVGIEEVLEMWIGQSERNLHSVFEKARNLAPTVLFFDEVEALGGKRTTMSTHAGKPLVNQFLSEMDGLGRGNDRVLIMGATNAPWDLDPAFRRPGRFDRVVFIPPPDLQARIDILSIHLKGKPAAEIDLVKIAKKTEDFSGADLAGLVDRAAENGIRESMKSGKIRNLSTDDLMKTVAEMRASTGEWMATARNYVQYANESGIYDEVAGYLKSRGRV